MARDLMDAELDLIQGWKRNVYSKKKLPTYDAGLPNSRSYEELSVEEFRQKYEIPSKPVVIRNVATEWPANERWTLSRLL